MPNDDSTPQMFENRNGLSSVTTVELPGRSLAARATGALRRADVARQPDVPVDDVAVEQLQVAARQPSKKVRDVGFREVRGPAGEQLGAGRPGSRSISSSP